MNNLPADKLAHIKEEVVEEKEEAEEDEEEENDSNVHDACLWRDPFLDQHNLEMKIPNECGVMVQVPVGFLGLLMKNQCRTYLYRRSWINSP